MIDWDKTTDEEMRAWVVRALEEHSSACIRQAESCEYKASLWSKFQMDDLVAEARRSRRQAAHYQQAIDLLTAAPMPETT